MPTVCNVPSANACHSTSWCSLARIGRCDDVGGAFEIRAIRTPTRPAADIEGRSPPRSSCLSSELQRWLPRLAGRSREPHRRFAPVCPAKAAMRTLASPSASGGLDRAWYTGSILPSRKYCVPQELDLFSPCSACTSTRASSPAVVSSTLTMSSSLQAHRFEVGHVDLEAGDALLHAHMRSIHSPRVVSPPGHGHVQPIVGYRLRCLSAFVPRGPPRNLWPRSGCTKSMMVVVPPASPAAVPVSKSSEETVPATGNSMCTWGSTPPGRTRRSIASRTCSLGDIPLEVVSDLDNSPLAAPNIASPPPLGRDDVTVLDQQSHGDQSLACTRRSVEQDEPAPTIRSLSTTNL